MNKETIEGLPNVKQAARVLHRLSVRGLILPSIAGGWTRSMLLGLEPGDIDVSYVGDVHYEVAQAYLTETLNELGLDPSPWDIKGIWNSQIAWGVTTPQEGYLSYYVCSLNSVYLAADGRLYDPTGHGFEDGANRVLRLNMPASMSLTPGRLVYKYLSGLWLISLNLTPTEESAKIIREGVALWGQLTTENREWVKLHIAKRHPSGNRQVAKELYSEYGWGFIFDENDY